MQSFTRVDQPVSDVMEREIVALLIDDNPVDNFVNRKVMERASFASKIVVVESGQEALQYLESVPPEEYPDYIFLDISMPVMNGFEFLDSYKELPTALLAKSRIYLLTSSMHPDDIYQANEYAQVKAFLHKPLRAEKLRQICA